jgi:hypothetical protein
MIDLQLNRRNISREMQSYLRGKRYLEEKKACGGVRGNQYTVAREHNVPLPKTSDKIADECNVSHMTIKRDAVYAEAVDSLAEGERKAVISGKSPYTKKDIIDQHLIKTGKKQPKPKRAAPEKQVYQVVTKKAIEIFDDGLAGYSHDLCVEMLEIMIKYLRHNQHQHLTTEDADKIWRRQVYQDEK